MGMIKRVESLLFLILVACSSGKNFVAESRSKATENQSAQTGAGPSGANSEQAAAGKEPGVANEPDPNTSPSPDGGSEPPAPGAARTETFTYGPMAAKTDFLFVFDNSGSMRSVLSSVASGFEGLADAKWPADSRIAVMTTLPGDPSNLNQVHPAVSKYQGIELEPGFLNFISASAVTAFEAVVGRTTIANSYPIPVCDKDWFLPPEKNATGVTCLRAALQSKFAGVGAEAGLTAVFQLVQKRPSAFRPNSHVQVVFVSDTQDPGKDSADLIAIRPNFQKLEKEFETRTSIAKLRIHGVVPGEGCTTNEGTTSARSLRGMPYQDAIRASGGVWLNFCDGSSPRTNYDPVAEQILAGSLPDPVFSLGKAAAQITGIKVDGVEIPVTETTLDPDGSRVRLNDLAPSKDVKVEITYEPKN
jgi:hypothetical protein